MVRSLLIRQGLGASQGRPRAAGQEADEWTLPELSYTLAMPHMTLYGWLQKGRLQARREPGSRQWLIWANAGELQRLRVLRQAPRPVKRPSPRESGATEEP